MDDSTELPARRRVIDHKTIATGRISDSARVVGFGLLVIYFTVMLSDSPFAEELRSAQSSALSVVGALGVLTILFDYLQYLCATSSAKVAMKRDDHLYDPKSKVYQAQEGFFQAKQVTAILGAALVIVLMALAA